LAAWGRARAPDFDRAGEGGDLNFRPYAFLNLFLLRSDFLQHWYNICTTFSPRFTPFQATSSHRDRKVEKAKNP
jgi:hypothetical protein